MRMLFHCQLQVTAISNGGEKEVHHKLDAVCLYVSNLFNMKLRSFELCASNIGHNTHLSYFYCH